MSQKVVKITESELRQIVSEMIKGKTTETIKSSEKPTTKK